MNHINSKRFLLTCWLSVARHSSLCVTSSAAVCPPSHLCLLYLSQCVFTVKPLCETSPPEIWATSSTALRSGLLIINLNAEKVTTGSPGVTVAMTTLINILSPLICWSVGSAELLRWFTVTVLWHMWTEAGGWELLCHNNLIPVVVKDPIILSLSFFLCPFWLSEVAGDSLCLSLYQKLE